MTSRDVRLREMQAEWDQMFSVKLPTIRIAAPNERKRDWIPEDDSTKTAGPEAVQSPVPKLALPRVGGDAQEGRAQAIAETRKRILKPIPESSTPKQIQASGDVTPIEPEDEVAPTILDEQSACAPTPAEHSEVCTVAQSDDIGSPRSRFNILSKKKLTLRQGSLASQTVAQLKMLHRTVEVRKEREFASADLVKTYVFGGTYFMKLESDGSRIPCLVGVGGKDAVTFWWQRADGSVTAIPLGELIQVKYGLDSECFSLLQKSKTGALVNVLPWNCFTVVFRSQTVNFFADRKKEMIVRTENEKRSIVQNYAMSSLLPESVISPSIDRLVEVEQDVETFLYGFAIVFRKERYERGSIKTLAQIPGLVVCLGQLRWQRALIKLDYLTQLVFTFQRTGENRPAGDKPAPVVVRGGSSDLKPLANLKSTRQVMDMIERRSAVKSEENETLVKLKANLKPWKIPEEVLGPIVLKQVKGLHKSLQVRRDKEKQLYSVVERQVLGGTYFLRIDDSDISKSIPCLVGIGGEESVTLWWREVSSDVVTMALTKVVCVEYGIDSSCYQLLQRAKTGDMLNVLPWNCFTVVLNEGGRRVHFYADRRRRAFVKLDRMTGKRILVTNRATDTFRKDPIIIESAERLGEVDDDVEKFLFGFAVCFRQERSQRTDLRVRGHIPGLPMSYNQLRLRRAIMKMEYVQNLTADDLMDLVN
jgi:hypothetical protein